MPRGRARLVGRAARTSSTPSVAPRRVCSVEGRPVDAKRERNSGTPARREERRPTGTRHAATAAAKRRHLGDRDSHRGRRRGVAPTERGARGGWVRRVRVSGVRARRASSRSRSCAGRSVRLRRQQPPRFSGLRAASPAPRVTMRASRDTPTPPRERTRRAPVTKVIAPRTQSGPRRSRGRRRGAAPPCGGADVRDQRN